MPLLDLQAQYRPIRDEILEAVTRVCDSQRFILGQEVEGLERELASYLGVAHAVGVSSGTDALLRRHDGARHRARRRGHHQHLLLLRHGRVRRAPRGDAGVRGHRPGQLQHRSRARSRAAITPRTKAIIPVHLYGQSADLDPILDAANRAGVPVIEDAAQAIGARYKGRMVGGFGRAGCFSFFPSKNLGAFGDGGLVTTDDDALAASLRLLRVHGADRQYYHEVIGGNFRLDALQAAVLRVKLPHLAGLDRGAAAQRRPVRRAAGRVRARRTASPAPLRGRIATTSTTSTSCACRIATRVKAHLEARHVGCAIYYPVPFHQLGCFAHLASPAAGSRTPSRRPPRRSRSRSTVN